MADGVLITHEGEGAHALAATDADERIHLVDLGDQPGPLLGRGYAIERIYNTNTDYQDNFVADTTPRRFFNGNGLPAALAPGSGFGWSGDTQDVIDAFNVGRF
jgi:hypothetical protein